MVTGDRTYLTHSLRVGFERTGSFHMLVVSGFHLAIVAGCLFWFARRLRLPRVPATLLTILVSFAYALFTGFATPVQRSLWMVTLYLLGRLLYRERSPLNTIGFAALCLLAASPRSLFDSSFQMTLLAVVAIAGVAAPLLQATIHPYVNATRDLRLMALDVKLSPQLAQSRVILRMLALALQAAAHPAARMAPLPMDWCGSCSASLELLVVSCVVELAMALPMALYFHRITLFALPVNLFILPLLLVLMPAALLTLLALLLWPAVAVFRPWLWRWFFTSALAWSISSARWPWEISGFPRRCSGNRRPSARCWAQPSSLRSAALPWQSRWPPPRRLGSAAAGRLGSRWLPRPIDHPHDALLVEAIDVGQGDSLLLITPDGKTLLVDGGGFGGGPARRRRISTSAKRWSPQALWARGIRHLDAVALTHAHSDHMGGLPAVLRNFHPDELWVGNNPRFGCLQRAARRGGRLHVRAAHASRRRCLLIRHHADDVLAPFRNYQPGASPPTTIRWCCTWPMARLQ